MVMPYIYKLKKEAKVRDKRIEKVKQQFDIFLSDQKLKVISCKINEAKGVVSIKTKVFGQDFPRSGRFVISIPSQNITEDLNLVFQSMSKDTSIEHWIYSIITD